MEFKDYFSEKASAYSKFRPGYPPELFEYLASVAVAHETAWDCATGAGQAALGLTPFFDRIIATDASEKQIANGVPHGRIVYRVTPAENSGIDSDSVDLIVVAQALHWFEFDKFYAEVRRVLKPGGVIAVWSYSLLRVAPSVDRIIGRFNTEVVGPFWPPERSYVDGGYLTVPFPFTELPGPEFKMETRWSLEHLIGYLSTWSSVKRFKDKHQTDPIETIDEDLKTVWGRPEDIRLVVWPINLRVGKV
jgi:SAM-dependent methyltransferase